MMAGRALKLRYVFSAPTLKICALNTSSRLCGMHNSWLSTTHRLSPQRVTCSYRIRPCRSIRKGYRIVLLAILWAPLMICYYPFKWIGAEQIWHNWLMSAIHRSGALWIKFAQWIASRPDLFPKTICETLSEFHFHNKSHSWECTLNTIGLNAASRLGLNENSVVVGSGAVAQVYKGDFEGRPVAVKVLHPDVHEWVEIDLELLKSVIWVLDDEVINWNRALEQFEAMLNKQIDLRIEANNLRIFKDNFGGYADIDFPEVFDIDKIDRRAVLVEEWVDGQIMSDFIKNETDTNLRQSFARKGLDAFLKMIFVDNFVHSDLHKGNMFAVITEDDHKIVFIDAGLVTTLEEKQKRDLKDLFSALVWKEWEEAGRLLLRRAPHHRCNDEDKFCDDIKDLLFRVIPKGLTLDVAGVGSVLQELLDICQRNGVSLDVEFANLVTGAIVVEGVGRELDPTINIINNARRFL